MPVEFRQKAPRHLTEAQRKLKLQKDTDYELAVQNESMAFYQKKHSAGVTPKEQADFDASQAKLWNDYVSWAKGEGLYEEVSVEQQLTRAEERLNDGLKIVNELRTELGRVPLEVKERLGK